MFGNRSNLMVPRICALAAIAIILWLAPDTGWAWGRLGHRVSARFAQDRLTPAAQAAIKDLLEPGESLADISTWADEQRLPGTGPWHYVNVPISEKKYDSRFCQAGGCVVSKIHDFRRVLQDRSASRAAKLEALRYLVHLIQDLHNPVHVGDDHDRGGNNLQLRFFGTGSNLHRVWDSEVIERHSTNEQVWIWEFLGLAKPEKVKAWSSGTPEDWATESLTYAKVAYRDPVGKAALRSGAKLGNDYCRFALPIIQRRLAQTGVRLAGVLNGVFG